MNLHPPKMFEKVTIVMVPLEQYSVFPKAIDDLFKNTRHPFDLIVVEGNAPHSIRHELEKRAKRHTNIKIIYSAHIPRMNEAYNLGRVHIRTRYAFFMHNNIRVTPDWLKNLLHEAHGRSGIVCPYFSREMSDNLLDIDFTYPVAYDYAHAHKKEIHGVNTHGFLISKDVLEKLGEFDENVCALLSSVDLNMRVKERNIDVWIDPHTVLDYEPPSFPKSTDLKLFHRQWEREMTHRSFAYLKNKWGAVLDEKKCMEWLERKRAHLHKKPSLVLHYLPLSADLPVLSLKKFIRGLVGA